MVDPRYAAPIDEVPSTALPCPAAKTKSDDLEQRITFTQIVPLSQEPVREFRQSPERAVVEMLIGERVLVRFFDLNSVATALVQSLAIAADREVSA